MNRRATLAACLLACGPAHAQGSRISNHPNVWNFSGNTDGNSPRGDLLIDAQGVLYGTTSVGGSNGDGAVFAIVPPPGGSGPGTETTLWSFTGGADGSIPSAGVTADTQGNLYGTASIDGANLGGTVFELTPPAPGQTSWTETTLWSFGAGQDGRTPVGNLLLLPDGGLVGTTNWGGTGGRGAVFELLPPGPHASQWTEAVIWNFTGGPDGGEPVAGLVTDASGALYGTTKAGGSGASGTVFKLSPPANGQTAWTQTTLWSFSGGKDGAEPTGALVTDASGALYGTTEFGGPLSVTCAQARYPYYGESEAQNAPALNADYVPKGGNQCGTVFKLSPPKPGQTAWSLSAIHDFVGQPDGAAPAAALTFLPDGSLIGLTTQYGARYYGSAFRLTPPVKPGDAWAFVALASFVTQNQGFDTRGGLALGPSGLAYATMTVGGDTWKHVRNLGYGTLFSIAP